MIKLHQPPRKFLGDTKRKADIPNNGSIQCNLVHRLLMNEMSNVTSSRAGRRLFTNAVELWTVDGCNLSAINGTLSGLSVNGLE
ncbi:MAG: hypothetical protein H7240_06180 [Glaciimonas sp.]|nr:hypothetical protein [Glaciimonas sp.]